MTLLVRDANNATQPISTQPDVAGNLVPAHVPASIVGGIAQPNSAAAPLAVLNTAGAAAIDGSGTIATGAVAQVLFAGAIPENGFLVANLDGSELLFVSDAGTASATGSSIPIGPTSAANSVFATPSGYRPIGPVSVFATTTAHAFAARRW